MSASSSKTVLGPRDAEGLRKVEKDVLISKKMKSKAMKLCEEYIKEFEDCVRGRTISVAWHCRKQNQSMKDCLINYYKDAGFYEECKTEYLKEREQFRETGVAPKKMKRTS